jgi:hypothetical protein
MCNAANFGGGFAGNLPAGWEPADRPAGSRRYFNCFIIFVIGSSTFV